MVPSRERRGALVVLATTVLLAVGVRLSEEPALAAAARTVRNRPLENAAAAAGWVAQTLWSPGPVAQRMARAGCEERHWR